MKTILKGIIAMSAAMIVFSSCDKILDVDSISLEGVWLFTNADERVVEDGTVHYTFLEDGKCLVAAYNALGDPENATRYTACTWSLAGDILSIDAEGGFNFRLSCKSKDKILCTSDLHSTEYCLTREKGTDYSAAIGAWSGERTVTMIDKDAAHDLFDPEYEGNIIEQVSVTYNGKEYKVEQQTKAYFARFDGLTHIWYEDGHRLVFGQFAGDKDYEDMTLTVNWPDGEKDVIVYNRTFKWGWNGEPEVKESTTVNGEKGKRIIQRIY